MTWRTKFACLFNKAVLKLSMPAGACMMRRARTTKIWSITCTWDIIGSCRKLESSQGLAGMWTRSDIPMEILDCLQIWGLTLGSSLGLISRTLRRDPLTNQCSLCGSHLTNIWIQAARSLLTSQPMDTAISPSSSGSMIASAATHLLSQTPPLRLLLLMRKLNFSPLGFMSSSTSIKVMRFLWWWVVTSHTPTLITTSSQWIGSSSTLMTTLQTSQCFTLLLALTWTLSRSRILATQSRPLICSHMLTKRLITGLDTSLPGPTLNCKLGLDRRIFMLLTRCMPWECWTYQLVTSRWIRH